jgi:hypothetical protein
MPARIPLDVDLEDRLLYGLTPTRLAYLVVALLAGFSSWSTHWSPPPVRASAGAAIGLVGAAAAWGRWRGRPVDSWVADIVHFCLATYRISWRRPRLTRGRRQALR